MNKMNEWIVNKGNPPFLLHAARTALAVAGSYFVARAFHLPEAYWASISAIIAMQSTLGTSLPISMQCLASTAIGATLGAAAAFYFPRNVWALGISLFILGLVCALFRIQRVAYPYAGITLALVILATGSGSVWLIAIQRFVEVSLGIGVSLFLATIWPERRP